MNSEIASIETSKIRPGAASASRKLVDSVKRHGIYVPIIVAPTPGDMFEYAVVDGGRRLDAAKKLGLIAVPAFVFNDDSVARDKATVTINEVRSYNPIAEWHAVNSLRAKGGFSDKQICAETGIPMARLRKIDRIAKADQKVAGAFASGAISMTMAGRIAGLSKEKQAACAKAIAKNIAARKPAFRQTDLDNVRSVEKSLRLPEIDLGEHDRINGARSVIAALPVEKAKVEALLSAFDAILKPGG